MRMGTGDDVYAQREGGKKASGSSSSCSCSRKQKASTHTTHGTATTSSRAAPRKGKAAVVDGFLSPAHSSRTN